MITYLGSIIPEEDSKWFAANSVAPIPVSSDTHQKSIIQGLRAHEETFVLYSSPSGMFPIHFKKAFVWGKRLNKYTYRIMSSNIPILRVLINIHSQKRALLMAIANGADTIVCYMPFYNRMKAIYKVKKKCPRITVVVIVPDLVEHSYSNKGSGIRRWSLKELRKMESISINKMSKKIDGFVYLAEKMKDKIGKGKPYIIQEAIYNMDIISETTYTNEYEEFIFTYCGKLDETNGVDRLIKAFMQIKEPNIQLYLCGTGELLGYAHQRGKEDPRIRTFGHVSHSEVVEIERQSTVLVNPRYTSIENAAYSFPSKLIEYMACGRPVITSHLAGIPKAYDEHVFYVEDDSVDGLKKAMYKILKFSRTELNNIGKANAEFVKQEKSSIAQGRKLLDFISEIKEDTQKDEK